MCRSAPQSEMRLSYSDIGYSTPITAGKALHDWYIIHQWSLNAIGDAVIQLHGGIDHLLESGPQTIVFTVKPGPSSETGGNPAKAFKLFNVSNSSKGNITPSLRSVDGRCNSAAWN